MIRTKNYDAYFKAVDGSHCSRAFKDLIVRLLAYKPNERPTINEIRQDPWLNDSSYNADKTRSKLLGLVHEISSKQQKQLSKQGQ